MIDEDGYGAYKKSQVETRAASASNEQLVVMLVDGFLDEISRLEGHLNAYKDPTSNMDIKSKSLEKKGQSINRCLAILRGLDTALDHETGGDLAQKIHDLYDFMGKKLLDVSISNDLSELESIRDVMGNLREGWVAMAAA